MDSVDKNVKYKEQKNNQTSELKVILPSLQAERLVWDQ